MFGVILIILILFLVWPLGEAISAVLWLWCLVVSLSPPSSEWASVRRPRHPARTTTTISSPPFEPSRRYLMEMASLCEEQDTYKFDRASKKQTSTELYIVEIVRHRHTSFDYSYKSRLIEFIIRPEMDSYCS